MFGTWVIRFREFALVRVDSESGHAGFAYCLTRDGPVASVVERTVGPVVVGQPVADPAATFRAALWSNHAIHASGVGMRAVSVVDVAAWDLAAKAAGQDIASFLGGAPRPLPVTAIVGYPPSISAQDTVDQIAALWTAGWRRFKLPIGLTPDDSVERLRLAREAFPKAWLGLDNNFLHRTADEAIAFGRRLDGFGLGWFEDIVPPGDAAMVAAIRQGIATPIAMGDEQGGSYHPQALLAHDAVDVLRIDATTNGGVTRLREIVAIARERGVPVGAAPVPPPPQPVLAAIGRGDEPIEWGIRGPASIRWTTASSSRWSAMASWTRCRPSRASGRWSNPRGSPASRSTIRMGCWTTWPEAVGQPGSTAGGSDPWLAPNAPAARRRSTAASS